MPAPTIDNTLGALEIGSSIAVFLFGILTLQTYLYFTRFGKDRIQIQALVRRKIVQWLDANNPFAIGWHSLVKRPLIPLLILLILYNSIFPRCLELGHTISVASEVYRTTILRYGQPEAANRFPGFGALMILGGLVTMLVQVRRKYFKGCASPS